MKRSVRFLTIVFLSVVVATVAARTEPSGVQQAWSAYPLSPIATPTSPPYPPPPNPTPPFSPALEQIALQYVAALEGTPLTDLVIANEHVRRYVLTSRNLQAMTVLSHRTG